MHEGQINKWQWQGQKPEALLTEKRNSKPVYAGGC